ncbi:MAG: hypothetical protein ACI9BO_001499 [Zhongshania sp.]|jgi:hypothetical protein
MKDIAKQSPYFFSASTNPTKVALRLIILSLISTAIMACADRSVLISDCNAVGDKQALCGWQSPEDMELLPDGKTLLVSEMAKGHGRIAGHLSVLDTETDMRKLLTILPANDQSLWGQAQCVSPVYDELGPHGIHLSQRADGMTQLLVVNHGSRESVEYYQVLNAEDGYQLQWRGCAIPPEGSFLNDVVALPTGGFIATHMYSKTDAPVGSLNFNEIKALLGFSPGYLLHFDGQGFSRLGNYEGNYPNGIQISADGRQLYVNLWAESKIQKLDSRTGEVLAEAEVTHPDNVQWDTQGNLLVTGHDFTINDLRICLNLESGACPGSFEVIQIEPETMATKKLLRHRGPPMGAATVTQQVGNNWYLGSFVGDRLLKMPAPSQP